ncbi:hypothetical protein GDO81_015792 [Engystomops pustulosus]|uniref:Uncharacterized protein n=1 Tax=Engystomops pustulosus TaxID=76066 RepID=A0AAV7AX82_ENGPU|nr:hypothetical protein GDO81_015792 [Engystomops pustulosus]
MSRCKFYKFIWITGCKLVWIICIPVYFSVFNVHIFLIIFIYSNVTVNMKYNLCHKYVINAGPYLHFCVT